MTRAVLVIVVLAAVAGAIALAASRRDVVPPRTGPLGLAMEGVELLETSASTPRHPVVIHRPEGPPRLDAGDRDALGRPVLVACSTCHSLKTPAAANRATDDLDEFHQDLVIQHGPLACLSCHNAADYDTLRLADGASVDYADVMTLCGQCHGPQVRDYEHGAHGGMIGYWDLTRGPRERNTCTDCHDPHAPAFPKMMPTFKPIDRFLTAGEGAHDDE